MVMFKSKNNSYLFPLRQDRELQNQSQLLSKDFPGEKLNELYGYKVWKYSPAHIGIFKHAIDIFVPEKTDIIAAEDGVIIEIVQSHVEHGLTEDYAEKVNFFSILHKNEQITQYVHILKNSLNELNLKVGDTVIKGQVVAKTGRNGWISHDHLHFVVFQIYNGDYHSIPINFQDSV